jgi:hypothetical protein
MRVVALLTAIAALWAQPAAAVDLKTGLFRGPITSGTASVFYNNKPTAVVDLTGLALTFRFDTTTNLDGIPFGAFNGSFSIPDSPNQFLRGYAFHGPTYPDELVTKDADNGIHILGAVGGTNNSDNQFNLLGSVYLDAVYALNGNLKFTYHEIDGNDFKYDINVSNLRGLAQIQGAVPEPSTWALMILGVGFAGVAMRRRQRVWLEDKEVCFFS